MAEAKTLSLEFDLSDLINRRFDASRVRSINLDDLVLNLIQDDKKQWNAVRVISGENRTAAIPGSVFRGKASVSNATINVTTQDSRYLFQNVAGSLDFAKYPDIHMDLAAKDGAATVAIKGTWNFNAGGQLSITADGVDPSSIATSVPLKGAASIQATLAGTTTSPTANGSFKLPSGRIGDTTVSNASGDFDFFGNTLNLTNTRLNALGGAIQTQGPFSLDTLRYRQNMSGQNLDSSQLSDKDIQGSLDFTADVQGQGAWTTANADGHFDMGAGSVSGFTFESLSGSFAKRGATTRYFNMTAKIAGQSVYIGDAESLNNIKFLFKNPQIPGMPGIPGIPGVPRSPAIPAIPKLPGLPRLF